jgi:hypothetical protein
MRGRSYFLHPTTTSRRDLCFFSALDSAAAPSTTRRARFSWFGFMPEAFICFYCSMLVGTRIQMAISRGPAMHFRAEGMHFDCVRRGKGDRDVETADIPRFLFMGMILHCGVCLSFCIQLPLLWFRGWRRFEGVIVARWRVIRYPTRTGERARDVSRRTCRGSHVLYDIGFVSIKNANGLRFYQAMQEERVCKLFVSQC